jgi:hypothetical protein
MKYCFPAWSLFAPVIFCVVTSAVAGNEALDVNSIRKLTNNRTWALNWTACDGYPCEAFWDWHNDGSICARIVGTKRDGDCADDGRWRIDGNRLCWTFTWLGGGEGYKKMCVLVEPVDEGKYRTTRVGSGGITFFTFVDLSDAD